MSEMCERYEDLRVRWVDGDLAAIEAAELKRHLDACPACAGDVEAQHGVRAALREAAQDLRGRAPDALRRRVVESLAASDTRRGATVVAMRPRAARAGWGAVRQWVPRSAAAAVLLAVAGVVAVGALAPRGGVLAAQLALDHLKCLVIAPTEPHVEAADVERQWAASRGWSIGVPASSPDHGLELVGLRTCLYHDGQMAHVLYEHRGQRVSLFVMPHAEASAAALDLFGQQTRTWSRDGRTYALVAGEVAGPLDAVAEYFQAHAR